MMMPGMPQPQEQTWDEIVEQLKIQIANGEKSLLMMKAQLKEANVNVELNKEEGN